MTSERGPATLPQAVLALVPLIARRWRLSKDRRVYAAFRERCDNDSCSSKVFKRRLVEAGVHLAWAERFTPWRPRRDSRADPIIPGRDLDGAAFREWLAREAIRAARCDLLERDYPGGLGLDADDLEFDPGADEELEMNALIDRAYLEHEAIIEADGEYAPDVEERRAAARERVRAVRRGATPMQRKILDVMQALERSGAPVSAAAVARKIGLEPSTVRVQLHRLRRAV